MTRSSIFAATLCLLLLGAFSQVIAPAPTSSSTPVIGAQTAPSDGCILWDENHLYCMSCNIDALYFRVKSSCVRCGDTHCAKIDDKGNCLACEQGYYLRNGSVCVVVTHIPGCVDYATDAPTTICLACSADTLLVNNRCLKRVPYCQAYIPGTNLCANCSAGYTQSADWAKCVPGSIGNCLVYDCLGLCAQCNDDFPRLSPSRGLCLVEIDFCRTYLGEQNACKTCYDGYQLTSDAKACLPEIPHCVAYLTSTYRTRDLKCQTCEDGYYVAANALACVPTIPNCKVLNMLAQICDQCDPTFLATDDKKACLPEIPNCYRYESSNAATAHHMCCNCMKGYQASADETVCNKVCDAGQTLCPATNECVVVPDCCATDDLCGNCLTLKPTYSLCPALNACVLIPEECPNNNDLCGKCVCDAGFTWCRNNRKCVKIPDCCATWDNCGQCLTFKPGFTFCVDRGVCLAIPAECPNNHDDCGRCVCGQGQTWCTQDGDPQKFTCVNTPECCDTFDNCGNCLTFKSSFAWCDAISSCFSVPIECPNSNTCGVCDCPTGYSWCATNSQCMAVPDCCSANDGCGNCLAVKAGFTFCAATKQCFAIPADCPNDHDNCGNCVCTAVGFTWCASKKACVRVPDCCASNDSCGNCLSLKPGFTWCQATSACASIPAACPNDFDDCGNCKCRNPNQVWCVAQQKCVPIPACCATFDNCGNCLTLMNGFAFCAETNSCVQIPTACANNYDSCGRCICPAGQSWCAAQQKCVPIPSCCAGNDSCGKCTGFIAGFTWCPSTNACAPIPPECPNNHDGCGKCVCTTSNYSWCASRRVCVDIPDCCATDDSCGNCLTLKAGFSWCQATNSCFPIPADCPNNNNSCGQCVCPAGQSWCQASKSCVAIPSCCVLSDGCGRCLSFRPGTSWCPATNACANIPADCPNNNDNCGNCICDSGYKWCATQKRCVRVPSCCATDNSCGTCLTFNPGTAWCAVSAGCYNLPALCPAIGAHDCVTGLCTCPAGQTWCASSNSCVAVPFCCVQSDGCGRCLTFRTGTAWCAATSACYNIPADCPLSHNCQTGECLCATGFTWCTAQRKCIKVPFCCATFDNCGNCLTFNAGTAWCTATGGCYNLPALCPTIGTHDCATGLCLCPAGQTWCTQTNKCVTPPSCCATFDNCGNCLTFNAGTAWCALTSACYNIPADCPSNHNCQTLACVCPNGFTWCQAQKKCILVPSCCATNDNCGNCQTYNAGTGLCALTNACYNFPVDCPLPASHNCQTGMCLCPAGQSWCANTKQCVQIPSCCATDNGCGTCLTFRPGTSWCAATNACYNVPADCVANHNCQTGECLCSAGFTWCAASKVCVAIPSCCATWNNCGQCLTYKPGTGLCALTNACYTFPIDCPLPANHNCSTLQCVCPTGQTWCTSRKVCVTVPSCCKTDDNCGNCLSFNPNTGWCLLTGACYNVPIDCPDPGSHNCQTGQCTCPVGFSWCLAQKKCIRVPTCCATDDGCGNCSTYKAGTGLCALTNACYTFPTDCPLPANHNCQTLQCTCPTGQTWCPAQKACLVIPSCCQTWDACANCLTFKPGTGWCALTTACYNIPADCPANHNCQTLVCTCPAGQTWCQAQKACIPIPSCCATNDNCGQCLTFKAGTAWCTAINACYNLPTACPAIGAHNCQTGQCTCPTGQAFCPAQSKCIAIPSCCVTHNNCGVCDLVKENTVFINGVCYDIKIIAHCVVPTADYQFCQECEFNWIPFALGAYCRIAFCANYDQALDICNQCESGYTQTADKKACLPIIRECQTYAPSSFQDIQLTCVQCSFPYALQNNLCIIPNCIVQDLTTVHITCTQCLSNDARNPAKTICYDPIEKCASYFFTEPSGYGCSNCEFLWEPNTDQSLCIGASFNFMGWAGGASGSATSDLFAFNLSTRLVSWMAESSASGSSWSLLWWVQGYVSSSGQVNAYMTIRTLVTVFDPIQNKNVQKAYYMAVSNGRLIIQDGFSSSGVANGTQVPTANLQWVIKQAFPNNTSVYTIQFAGDSRYLNYDLTLVSTPVYYYFR